MGKILPTKEIVLKKRDSRLKLNVVANLGIRGANIIVNLAFVPIMLTYLGSERYGIWLTLYSLVGWIGVFDLGLGNGLKIILTESFSRNRINEIRVSISSAYILIGCIIVLLGLVFLITNLFFDWEIVLGLTDTTNLNIKISLNILLISFLLILFIKLVGVIYASLQMPYIDNLIKTCGQVLFLISIVILIWFNAEPSLILVSIFSVVSLIILYLYYSIYLFKIKKPFLLPKWRFFSRKAAKVILLPGFSFFIIQICMVVLYSSDNMIILNLLSPDAVTEYNISYKYFSMPFVFFTLYISTHWPAFIDALAKKDYVWISAKIRKFNYIYLFLIGLYYLFFVLYDIIVPIWVGDDMAYENVELNFSMVIYFLISSYATIYTYVINASGKIRVQLLTYILIAIINIPLSVFFVKYIDLGSSGVIIASALCVFLLLIILPIQYFKIITINLSGIWNK